MRQLARPRSRAEQSRAEQSEGVIKEDVTGKPVKV
jgi:hypothetical protein